MLTHLKNVSGSSWMSPEHIINATLIFPECVLNIWKCLSKFLNVSENSWMPSECIINVTWMSLECIANVTWMYCECNLNVSQTPNLCHSLVIRPKYHLNVNVPKLYSRLEHKLISNSPILTYCNVWLYPCVRAAVVINNTIKKCKDIKMWGNGWCGAITIITFIQLNIRNPTDIISCKLRTFPQSDFHI